MTECRCIPGRAHVEQDGRLVCVGYERTWPYSCADPDPAYRQAMSEAMAAYRASRRDDH